MYSLQWIINPLAITIWKAKFLCLGCWDLLLQFFRRAQVYMSLLLLWTAQALQVPLACHSLLLHTGCLQNWFSEHPSQSAEHGPHALHLPKVGMFDNKSYSCVTHKIIFWFSEGYAQPAAGHLIHRIHKLPQAKCAKCAAPQTHNLSLAPVKTRMRRKEFCQPRRPVQPQAHRNNLQKVMHIWYHICIYVYMCVYIYIFIYVYIYVYIHTYIKYIYICMYICICIYIYMYICIYVYMYICIYVYVYIYICIYIYVYIYVYIYICIYIYMYIYICTYICIYIYVYMYIYIYVYMYICIYAYARMYTSIHVYMYICIYVFIYICMYVCIHVYMYICIYVYMYICIYVYMYICIWRFFKMSVPGFVDKSQFHACRLMFAFKKHDLPWWRENVEILRYLWKSF